MTFTEILQIEFYYLIEVIERGCSDPLVIEQYKAELKAKTGYDWVDNDEKIDSIINCPQPYAPMHEYDTKAKNIEFIDFALNTEYFDLAKKKIESIK